MIQGQFGFMNKGAVRNWYIVVLPACDGEIAGMIGRAG